LQFWELVVLVQTTFGESIGDDIFATHVSTAWNQRHTKTMETNEIGLGGLIRDLLM
jgi:hypothetical protein